MGEALVQVSQPRVPCYKVNVRSGRSDMLQLVWTVCAPASICVC
ncbi:MAG: MOSC domain-containing protein [Bacillota bacterium]